MNNLPAYLATKGDASSPGSIADSAEAYRPLIGAWLLEMALALGWYRKSRRQRLPDVFGNEYFRDVTGVELSIAPDDEDDEFMSNPRARRIGDAALQRILKQALAKVRRQKLAPDLPLFRNVELLGRLLGLNDTEMSVLTFFIALQAFPDFNSVVSIQDSKMARASVIRLLAILLGRPDADIAAAMHDEATLPAARILWFDWDHTALEHQMNLISGLSVAMLAPNATAMELADRFLKRTSAPTLDCSAFPHLAKDIATVTDYLGGVVAERTRGANVLLYGPPGTGKTEVAKAIAAALGVELYEVGFADTNGDPIKGTRRLAEFNLCQRLLAQQRNAILMFDEIEDVFESRHGFWSLFGGSDGDSGHGKAWINRTLERNPTPAIWITNDADIDPAYLRRFDYSVRFPIPPQSVRLTIAQRHLGNLEPPEGWLERIAANEHTSPAQLEAAAKVARVVAKAGDLVRAREVVEQTLDRSATLLDQKRTPPRLASRTHYDMALVNADLDVARIVARLKVHPIGTFCFYGPAGTGKSELAKHIADEIGKPTLVRRASDILSMWLGGSEKNIARMFAEARQQDAVLVLDEADSFLADRRGARQSWEVTQVNELLTQMEAFEGIFVCTTNLMQALDQASLRRFAFKVRFDYLNADQRWQMFRQELARLRGDVTQVADWEASVRRLERVTPGDFAVAARQAELWGVAPTASELYEQLRKEVEAKGGSLATIGFAA